MFIPIDAWQTWQQQHKKWKTRKGYDYLWGMAKERTRPEKKKTIRSVAWGATLESEESEAKDLGWGENGG